MHNQGFSRIWPFILSVLCVFPALISSGMTIPFKKEGAGIQIIAKDGSVFGIGSVTTGDINGDGIGDIILSSKFLRQVSVIFGKRGLTKEIKNSERVRPDLIVTFMVGTDRVAPPLHVADVNGDGVGDLVIPNLLGVNVYLGRKTWPAQIDARTSPGDIQVIAEDLSNLKKYAAFSLVTTGDVNKDGIEDLFLTHTAYPTTPPQKPKNWNSRAQPVGWMLWGRKRWPPVINLNKRKADVVIWAEQPGPAPGRIRELAIADLDGDGFGDLIVGGWGYLRGPLTPVRKGPWGTGWIIQGSPHLPSIVKLPASPSNSAQGRSKEAKRPRLAMMRPWEMGMIFGGGLSTDDTTGDQKSDLILTLFMKEKKKGTLPRHLCILPGRSDFFNKDSFNVLTGCTLVSGSPSFQKARHQTTLPPVTGDFNGDGLDDVFLMLAYPEFVIKGLLGQARPHSRVDISQETTVTIVITKQEWKAGLGASMAMGDINGDHYADLLIVDALGGGESRKEAGPGVLRVVFGRGLVDETHLKNHGE